MESAPISTVVLRFEGPDGVVEGVWGLKESTDPLSPPTIEEVTLRPGSYDLQVVFEDRYQSSIVDRSEGLIRQRNEQYQAFVVGDGVESPASQATGTPTLRAETTDADCLGLPLGLSHRVEARDGETELRVLLYRLGLHPDGSPRKTADLAATLRSDPNLEDVPHSVVVDISIPVRVRP